MARRRASLYLSSDAEEFASRITSAFHKTVEHVIETGRLLVEAKAQLQHGEFEMMVRRMLPFGPRTAQSLMAIARHPVLSNTQYIADLPSSWGTLSDLTVVPEDRLKLLIEDGTINRNTKREEVKRLGFRRLDSLPAALKTIVQIQKQCPDPEQLMDRLLALYQEQNPDLEIQDGYTLHDELVFDVMFDPVERKALIDLAAWIEGVHSVWTQFHEAATDDDGAVARNALAKSNKRRGSRNKRVRKFKPRSR